MTVLALCLCLAAGLACAMSLAVIRDTWPRSLRTGILVRPRRSWLMHEMGPDGWRA